MLTTTVYVLLTKYPNAGLIIGADKNELNISSYIGCTIYQGENHLQKIFLLLLDLHYLLLCRLASHRPVSSGRET